MKFPGSGKSRPGGPVSGDPLPPARDGDASRRKLTVGELMLALEDEEPKALPPGRVPAKVPRAGTAAGDGKPGGPGPETAKLPEKGRGRRFRSRSGDREEGRTRPRRKRPVLRDSKGRRVEVRGKRAVLAGVAVAALLVFTGFLLYTYVIPRVQLDILTMYHEDPGSGGTGGNIRVNVLLENSGTLVIKDLELVLAVEDGEGNLLARSYHNTTISPGNDAQPRVSFRGDQYATYFIQLRISFVSNDDRFEEVYRYDTSGEAMNQPHSETMGAWGI